MSNEVTDGFSSEFFLNTNDACELWHTYAMLELERLKEEYPKGDLQLLRAAALSAGLWFRWQTALNEAEERNYSHGAWGESANIAKHARCAQADYRANLAALAKPTAQQEQPAVDLMARLNKILAT